MLDNQSLKNEKLLFAKNIKIIKRNYSRFHFNQNLTIQQSTGRHVTSFRHINLITSQQIFALTP